MENLLRLFEDCKQSFDEDRQEPLSFFMVVSVAW
jgi:hypothetical protein